MLLRYAKGLEKSLENIHKRNQDSSFVEHKSQTIIPTNRMALLGTASLGWDISLPHKTPAGGIRPSQTHIIKAAVQALELQY